MNKVKGRPTYDALRERGISTRQLYEFLIECNIVMSQKSIQNYLDVEFENCADDRIKDIAKAMIKEHDEMRRRLLTKFNPVKLKILKH